MENEKLRVSLKTPPRWTDGKGELAEIVLSSRIRLARNLRQFNFPWKAKENEIEDILEFIKSHIDCSFITSLSEFSSLERICLVERHIISRKFSRETKGKGVGIWEGENIALMINEEDHLRLRSIYSGISIGLAYEKLNELDDEFSKELPYAFSPKFGYFTACPTNTGTGLRASVLVHLPGLVHSGKIKNVLEKLNKIGFLVKGFYGDETIVEGNFFQISNQTTLGRKEEEIVEGLHKTVLQVIEYENIAREFLLKNARTQVEDKVWRAYSVLKNARLLSNGEFVNLSSAVRFGIGLGILKEVKLQNLNKLLVFTQPAHLEKRTGKIINPGDIDARRALFVRENL